MNKKIFILFAFSFLFYLGFVSASINGSTEWNVTLDENGTAIDYEQMDYSIAEFDVIANVSATQHWAEVQLDTDKIDFGFVKRGNKTTKEYRIWARGNVDIKVKPTLKESADNIFSNLYFSRTPTSGFDNEIDSKIGNYFMRFNLTQNVSNWLAIGSSSMEPRKVTTSSNGKQYIRLDLTGFGGIVPFDEIHTNTVKFVITPIWSSVEPLS